MEKNLTELLELQKITKISTLDELTKIFNLDILDEDKQPLITTKSNTLLIFDHSDFNNTYLIDIVNGYFFTYPEFRKKLDIFYIDDFELRCKIFIPSVSLEDKTEECIEKNYLSPGFMSIIPKINSIDFIKENFLPLIGDNFEELMQYFKING